MAKRLISITVTSIIDTDEGTPEQLATSIYDSIVHEHNMFPDSVEFLDAEVTLNVEAE